MAEETKIVLDKKNTFGLLRDMDGDGDIDSDDERLYAIQKSQHMKK